MFKSSISKWLAVVVLLAVLMGIVGGGVMGAVAGYYVAQNRAVQSGPQAIAQLTAAQSPGQSAALGSPSVVENSAITDIVKKAEPAVVTVVSTVQSQSRRFGRTLGTAEGSGVIIDAQGHILTNAHVVDGAQQVAVILSDGTQVNASIVGADSNHDIAVLKVRSNVPAYLSLGDSSALQLGEGVIAIGSPLGSYQGSVTTGVVSGLDRTVDGSGLSGLIQTDAAINHGNSGGPLLNLSGQVIGINTLVVQNTDSGDLAEGLGFAIPSNTISGIAQQIIASGRSQ